MSTNDDLPLPEPQHQQRARLLAQIAACRREVARWPEWMVQECYVPAWMTSHATDL